MRRVENGGRNSIAIFRFKVLELEEVVTEDNERYAESVLCFPAPISPERVFLIYFSN